MDEAGDHRTVARQSRKDPGDLRGRARRDEAFAASSLPESPRQMSDTPPVPALRRDDRASEEPADARSRLRRIAANNDASPATGLVRRARVALWRCLQAGRKIKVTGSGPLPRLR